MRLRIRSRARGVKERYALYRIKIFGAAYRQAGDRCSDYAETKFGDSRVAGVPHKETDFWEAQSGSETPCLFVNYAAGVTVGESVREARYWSHSGKDKWKGPWWIWIGRNSTN